MAVNKVILLGHLGKDPELVANAQSPICRFSVATNERRKDANGNWTDHTEWHNIVTFGSTAENCAKYLKKGRQVFIEGKLATRKWQDKEGKDRYTTEVIGNTVQFIGNKGESAGGGYGGYDAPSEGANAFAGLRSADTVKTGGAGAASAAAAQEISFDDDDIPF
jgi:single-strand DNA-binding protein